MTLYRKERLRSGGNTFVPLEVTDEMVERAARAMCAVEDDSPWELSEAELELIDQDRRQPADTGAVPDEDKEWFRRHARAALVAAFQDKARTPGGNRWVTSSATSPTPRRTR